MAARRKPGELLELSVIALSSLQDKSNTFVVQELADQLNIYGHTLYSVLRNLVNHGYIERITQGRYRILKADGVQLDSVIQYAVNPLEEITKKINEIPDILVSLAEQLVELLIEPEIEIMNMIERRNKRITDLEVLLSKTKIESSNSRAKLSELMNKINKISALKNRVIPETKVVIR